MVEDLCLLEGQLERFRQNAQAVYDRTPPSWEEGSFEDLGAPARTTEVRGVLRCILLDHIEPALHSLRRLTHKPDA
jgi:hypothetical protein